MPDEPAEPPASPSMPADPFSPAATGYHLIAASFHGLRGAGAGLVEAALITAAHVVMNGLATEARKPPEHP